MSEPGEYESVEKVLEAVNSYVNSYKEKRDGKANFAGFKIEVYLGRGCHEFVLNDKLGDTAKEVEVLERRLAAAKDKLNTLKGAKRRRGDSCEHEFRDS